MLVTTFFGCLLALLALVSSRDIKDQFKDKYNDYFRFGDDQRGSSSFFDQFEQHDLEELFSVVDANMDGQVDGYEYLMYDAQRPENSGKSFTEMTQRVKDVFRKYNLKGNGVLNFEEFSNTPLGIAASSDLGNFL